MTTFLPPSPSNPLNGLSVIYHLNPQTTLRLLTWESMFHKPTRDNRLFESPGVTLRPLPPSVFSPCPPGMRPLGQPGGVREKEDRCGV